MSDFTPADFARLYARFQAPIAALDCGTRCAPYNERGVPFCCDTGHAVPTVYSAEWEYLQANTDLWVRWQADDPQETSRLEKQAPQGQFLVACQGHELCQRSYRSITCRAFPFFPYIDSNRRFLGLSYYWEYENRCWVISNLRAVTPAYRQEFIDLYDLLLERRPDELENFHQHSARMRRVFDKLKRSIPLLHRNGLAYKITPHNGRLRLTNLEKLPKFGPYRLASELPFPGEGV
jgi:hypothetical protein